MKKIVISLLVLIGATSLINIEANGGKAVAAGLGGFALGSMVGAASRPRRYYETEYVVNRDDNDYDALQEELELLQEQNELLKEKLARAA